jgi:DNA-binding transcriptional ArsR family regulator
MASIRLTEEQLRLVQDALDFYSRIGIGQFDRIKEHPTFENHLRKEFALGEGPFEVGDKTTRGEIVEIDPEGKWIKTKGTWNTKEEIREWTDVENIEYSVDYERYHRVRDSVDAMLVQPRNMLLNHLTLPKNASWGIYNPDVDESCRVAYDLIQVIRHEFWLANPDRSEHVVMSSVHLNTKDSNQIKVEL